MSFSPQFDSRAVASKEQFDAWYAFQNGDVTRFRVKREATWSAPFHSTVEGCVVGGLRFKRTTLEIPGDHMTTLSDKSAEHHPPVYCLQGPTRGAYAWQLENSHQPGQLRPGTLAIFDPATVRGHFTVSHSVQNFLVGIPQAAMPNWVRRVVHEHHHLVLAADNPLVGLTLHPLIRDCDAIFRAIAGHPESAAAYAQGLLHFLEAALAPLHHPESKSGKRPDSQAQREATYQALLSLIEANLADICLNAEKAAKQLRISPRYVYSLFAAHGTSFGNEVKRRRLARISAELMDPHFSHCKIKDIADRYGFYDASPFNKAFKAEFKMTPTDYRQLARQKKQTDT